MTGAATSLRADVALVKAGLFDSRARAREAIEAGLVTADGVVVPKPAAPVGETAVLRAEAVHPWVSRGGVKLAAALDGFGLSPAGLFCLDVGASTGGFTEVLLARGARRVVAVDVGHGQFHAALARDPRIRLLEARDARSLTPTDLDDLPSFLTIDVSFISLRLVLPVVLPLAAVPATLVALVKPQFEAGRSRVGKGVVRDPAIHQETCAAVAETVAGLGWHVRGMLASPIAGGDGNREFLLAATR